MDPLSLSGVLPVVERGCRDRSWVSMSTEGYSSDVIEPVVWVDSVDAMARLCSEGDEEVKAVIHRLG